MKALRVLSLVVSQSEIKEIITTTTTIAGMIHWLHYNGGHDHYEQQVVASSTLFLAHLKIELYLRHMRARLKAFKDKMKEKEISSNRSRVWRLK